MGIKGVPDPDGEMKTPLGNQRSEWMKALQELEESPSPIEKTPQPHPSQRTTPQAPNALPGREALSVSFKVSKDAAKGQGFKPLNTAASHIDAVEFRVKEAVKMLEDFVAKHPYLIAPNVYRMWEENMKEILVSLDRQRRGFGNNTPVNGDQ